MKRLVLFAVLAALPCALSAQEAGDAIRPLTLLTQPQAAAPQEFQAAQIIADAWRKLGVTVNVRPLPGQQFNQVIWYERQRWDTTTWQMVGRPERADPDELTYNLFVSANAANGYDFVGYHKPIVFRIVIADEVIAVGGIGGDEQVVCQVVRIAAPSAASLMHCHKTW